jgi:hypothetical protein
MDKLQTNDAPDIPDGFDTIFRNFLASLDLHMGETNNLSQDAHTVLAVFVLFAIHNKLLMEFKIRKG